ncbi:MAG TPA: NosD domain-containing protein [Candidatus Thermoplasmatota archaeon]|nr:NosD domain-containing protein [Candidatus Thermoplasmatota archaeon]
MSAIIFVGCLMIGTQIGEATIKEVPTHLATTTGWLYVGGGGAGNYSTIQAALDASTNGDTIFVYDGTYPENIIIGTSITLLGENKNTTIISGNGLAATANITAKSVTMKGFTIRNDGSQNGIYTSTSSHQIMDNIFTMTSHGIYLFYSSENSITDCLFHGNTHSGIYMKVGTNNTISHNEFYNNTAEGMYLTGCGSTHVERNNIHENGIGIHGLEVTGISITNNTIQSNSWGIRFDGMFTVHSNFNTISFNAIDDNTEGGIHIEHSQFNLIQFNEIKGNGKGIDFLYTGLNSIRSNVITSSHVVEIMLTFDLGDVITNNNINNSQQSLVLLQINFGVSDATHNWWGSTEWPLRRVRPIMGWAIILPWMKNPFTITVGPQ